MKLSLREKLMVCLLVWAVGIYLFYNYAYTPVKNEAFDWEEKNTLLGEQVISARQMDKNLKGMEDKQERRQDRYVALARQVPSMEYIPEIVAFVEDASEESGLDLMHFNYQIDAGADRSDGKSNNQSAPVDGVKNLDFNLTGWGSYYDALTFIESMEQAARIYNVREVALLANERSSEKPVQVSAGELSPSPAPELKGTSRFDPNHITLTMRFRTYCDGKAIPGINDVDNPIEPVSSKNDNPFTR